MGITISSDVVAHPASRETGKSNLLIPRASVQSGPQTARARRRGLRVARPVLVVGDRVEEVVLAGVELRVEHGAEGAEHGPAAVLELAREGAVARRHVLDLVRERVAARDRADRPVVAAGEVLRPARVLRRRHGGGLGHEAEGDDLEEAEPGHVFQRREAHAVLEDVRELDGACVGYVDR